MRIIAGHFRGRHILPPESDTTRPITDRVKQSLFDILSSFIPDALVYDCFAGTGSMGLECLSRGARHAYFFEADRSALFLLRKNIDTLDLAKQSTVVPGDLFKWMRNPPPAASTDRADLIFLDPPYRFLTEQPDALRQLARNFAAHHLAPAGTVVFRHDANDTLDLPDLIPYDHRTYGGMALDFLRPHH